MNMNKQQRELTAVHLEIGNVIKRTEQIRQEMIDLMKVDLTILNQKGIDEHHAKAVKLNDELKTVVEEYHRLKLEVENALKD